MSHPFPEGYFFCVKKTPDHNSDPRMGLVRILSSTKGGYLPVTQEDKLGVYRASYRRFIYVKLLFAYVWFFWSVYRYPHQI